MTDVIGLTEKATLPALERPLFAGLAPLACIVFLGFLSVAVPLPPLALHVHEALGFSAAVVGWVVGVQSLATVVTRDRAGRVCDAHGPRRAVLLGLPIAALSGVLYAASAVVPVGPGGQVLLILAGRVVAGLGESLFVTGTMMWGIARVGVPRTGKVMSWQGIALYASLGLGAPLGLAALGRFGFAGVGVVAAVAPMLAWVVAWRLPAVAPAAPAAASGERTGRWHVVGLIWRPGTVLALATVPFAALSAFLALDFAQRGWAGAGLALAGFGVAYVGVRLVASGLLERYGAVPVTMVSLGIELVAQVAVWAAPAAWVGVLGSVASGVGFSLVFPAMGVAATRLVSPAQRGRAVGNFLAFFDIALCLTGPVAGVVTVALGTPGVFLAGAAAVALGLVVLSGMGRGAPG